VTTDSLSTIYSTNLSDTVTEILAENHQQIMTFNNTDSVPWFIWYNYNK